MNRSEQVNELFAALAKARNGFKEIKKETENPFFKKKYADLNSIIAATYKSLSDNGLAVVQLPGEFDQQVTIETILTHSSGQWISERISMPVERPDAQKIGSAITYGRRYALQSLLNVAAEEDDDGNAAVSGNWKDKKDYEQQFADKRISDTNVRSFWREARKTGKTNDQIAAYLADLGHKQTEQIRQSEFDAALEWAKSTIPMPQDLELPLRESVSIAEAQKAAKTPVKGTGDPFWKNFWALAHKHNIPEQDVHIRAREMFNLPQLQSLKELNPIQMGKLIEWITATEG